MAPTTPSPVAVPLKVDAFVLNAEVCGGHLDDKGQPPPPANPPDAKIAPITQPNYTFLRLSEQLLQNDVLNHSDLHFTQPSEWNARFSDVGTKEPLGREGVYIHWLIPRNYRTGTAVSDRPSAAADLKRTQRGFPSQIPKESSPTGEDSSPDYSTADYPEVPTRWIIIRKIEDMTKIVPSNATIPQIQAWVIESDKIRELDDLDDSVDLQVDVSPFVHAVDATASIDSQAEIFIGLRSDADKWTETDSTDDRVPLKLLNSSNRLFADFQLHNSSVFSMHDRFEYGDGSTFLQQCTASYYILGWHSVTATDPFYITDKSLLGARLTAHDMALPGSTSAAVTDWSSLNASSEVMCHGSIYNVNWDVDSKPPSKADDQSAVLNSKTIPAVAIGSTPLDALYAYIASQDDKVTGDLKKVEDDLLLIESYLRAEDDGVESQNQAVDMMYDWSFKRLTGGKEYFIAASNDPSQLTQPSPDVINKVAQINQYQYQINAMVRLIQYTRWTLFANWWQCMTDITPTVTPDAVSVILNQISRLQSCVGSQTSGLTKLRDDLLATLPSGVVNIRSGANFYDHLDPTLLLGGIESGWPVDYMDPLQVRLNSQIVTSETPLPAIYNDLVNVVLKKLPSTELTSIASLLVGEFEALNPANNVQPQTGQYFPLYHDQKGEDSASDSSGPWRDRWNDIQPWFPLFLEWEAEYTHIGFDNWKLDDFITRNSKLSQIKYGIPSSTTLYETKDILSDQRIVSGRMFILPQASFSLGAKIEHLFNSLPPDKLESLLPQPERDFLKAKLSKLALLSSPLSGFMDHLLTRVQGSHVKPNIRLPDANGTIQPLSDAVRNKVSRNAGFVHSDSIAAIGIESSVTPYASLVRFDTATLFVEPFKPATHGQFRFTKLNIFDKFGQAIHAIDPTPPKIGDLSPPLYPCISDAFEPGTIKEGTDVCANTVRKSPANLCEYIQISPHINQPARLNSSFVKYTYKNPGDSLWTPVSDWENPIWGWVVINYADYGLQLFQPDGTFFGEVRLGGPLQAMQSPMWVPSNPTTSSSDPPPPPEAQQLFSLMKLFSDATYLGNFIKMINGALDNMKPTPSAYADYLNAIVGRPLAFTNIGYSLELSLPPYQNWSEQKFKNHNKNALVSGKLKQEPYQFPLKVGDFSRDYDGLVGYFPTKPKPEETDAFDFTQVYTYPSPELPKTTGGFNILSTDNYPKIQAFYPDPTISGTSAPTATDAYNYQQSVNAKENLTVIGALIDPFIATHAYSGILPITSVKLQNWTWQKALQKMGTFIHAGPVLLTSDPLAPPPTGPKTVIQSNDNSIPFPVMLQSNWNWLQPVASAASGESNANGGTQEGSSSTTAAAAATATTTTTTTTTPPPPPPPWTYKKYDLEKVDSRPKFLPGPLTAVEGFLRLEQTAGPNPTPPANSPTPILS
ncbi:hypothetical protein TWF730_002360 [Orbilia blumenaviensis]|uniref:Uncharacterized protein n=1 Tax=Orbilia blumenaviensis TaxID=1796055 RepID=A0AAV9UAG2_9PEZI